MTQSFYIIIERSKKGWRGLRIARFSKKKPTLPRPSEQALIKIQIELPDRLLEPKVVQVKINPEHIIAPTISAESSPA